MGASGVTEKLEELMKPIIIRKSITFPVAVSKRRRIPSWVPQASNFPSDETSSESTAWNVICKL